MRPNRPISISVIAWLLIVSSVVQFMLVDLARHNAEVESFFLPGTLSHTTPFLWVYSAFALTALCGALILNGLNWGRFVYVAQAAAWNAAVLAMMPFRLIFIPGLLGFIAAVIVLFLPRANAYFKGEFYPEDLRGRYWRGC